MTQKFTIKPLVFECCDFTEIQAANPIDGICYNIKQTRNGWAWRCNEQIYQNVNNEYEAHGDCSADWDSRILEGLIKC